VAGFRRPKEPTAQDLEIWRRINSHLGDWLYTGLTGWFQIAGHKMIDRWAKPYRNKIVLEIGCGHGHHLRYCRNPYHRYIGLDIERKFLQIFQFRFPNRILVQGDAYMLPFRDESTDCVLSVYNFEHLKLLPDSLSEIHRVLKPEGELLIGIPMEGGFLYGIGRRLTSKRYMEKKYGIDYDAIVHWEHWNNFREIIKMIRNNFLIDEERFLPFPFLPLAHLNVIYCLRTQPKPVSSRKVHSLFKR
jgi:SAM-dependent methyltransferase